MLQCNSYIKVTRTVGSRSGESIEFSFVNSIEIESSYEDLTDTCKITIPRKLQFEGKNLFVGDNPIFKRGDKIEVKIGYVPNLTTVFRGYIKKVSGNIPTFLECEDEMYLLKQTKITYPTGGNGKSNATIKNLLDAILTIPYNLIDDLPLGSITFTKVSVARVLDELKKQYGLFSYFVDGKLHIGFANDASRTKEAEFKMEEVVINSDDLEWQNEADMKIGVTAINMTLDNVKTEVTSGDPDGDQKTYHYTGLTTTELQKIADKTVIDFKYTGFKGNLETFGEPVLYHGDRCNITSVKLPERNGTYLIKKVTRNYSVGGGNKQIFNLGIKVA